MVLELFLQVAQREYSGSCAGFAADAQRPVSDLFGCQLRWYAIVADKHFCRGGYGIVQQVCWSFRVDGAVVEHH